MMIGFLDFDLIIKKEINLIVDDKLGLILPIVESISRMCFNFLRWDNKCKCLAKDSGL